MQPDVLLLGERLVLAVERMSKDVNTISLVMGSMGQDVKHISTYVSDLCSSMSQLLKEKKERDDIGMKLRDESRNVPPSPIVTEQEASAESEHTLEHEEAAGTFVGPVVEGENDGHFGVNAASVSPDYNEKSDIMPAFLQAVKAELLSEAEEYDQSNDQSIVYANNRNSVGTSEIPVTQEAASNHVTSNSEHEVAGINNNVFTDRADFIVNKEPIDSENFCAENKREPVYILSHITCGETVKNETPHGVIQDAPEEIEDKIDINEDWFSSPEVSYVHSTRGAQEDRDCYSDTRRPSASKYSVVHTRSEESVLGLNSCSEVDNYEAANGEREDKLRQHSSHCGESPQRNSTESVASSFFVEEKRREEDKGQKGEKKKAGKSKWCGTEERSMGTKQKQDTFKEGKWSSSSGKSSAGQHLRQKNAQQPFCCDTCGKFFSRILHLENNKRTHTGEKPFECTICHKAFSDKSNLVKHMKVHSDERPFKCSTCKKAFKINFHLQQHQLCHSGEKPFKCTFCRKAFSQNIHLTIHIRSHTGEKPYKCQECGKDFTDRSNLITHIRTHTGQKPFKCTVCEKAFKQNSQLTTHMRSHLRSSKPLNTMKKNLLSAGNLL